jgi:DNA-binding protein YbaB
VTDETRILRAQRELAAITGVERSPDGLVAAAVGVRGNLLGLRLDERVFRDHDSESLAEEIRRTVHAAGAAARRQALRVLRTSYPEWAVPPDVDPVYDPVLRELDRFGG